jgi:pimeloyl-ACP methyl ester carboxylesterase
VAAAARALAQRPDSTATLGRIDVPTLLVFGEEDRITPPDLARQMLAAIPGARLELIPAAGHLPPVEQPDRFLQAIWAFLAELPKKV